MCSLLSVSSAKCVRKYDLFELPKSITRAKNSKFSAICAISGLDAFCAFLHDLCLLLHKTEERATSVVYIHDNWHHSKSVKVFVNVRIGSCRRGRCLRWVCRRARAGTHWPDAAAGRCQPRTADQGGACRHPWRQSGHLSTHQHVTMTDVTLYGT